MLPIGSIKLKSSYPQCTTTAKVPHSHPCPVLGLSIRAVKDREGLGTLLATLLLLSIVQTDEHEIGKVREQGVYEVHMWLT